MRTLRDYQIDAVNGAYQCIRDKRNPLVYMATGSGKGAVFSQIASHAIERNKKVLIIVNKLILIQNAIKELKFFNLDCTEYSGKEKNISPLYESLKRVLGGLNTSFEIVFIILISLI